MSIDKTHARASDAVYEALRNQILDSTLAPGQRIASGLVSREMGLSRMPVKQAMERLAAEGLLVVRASTGTFVAEPSLNTTHEAFEVRIALELLAAARMLERLTPERLAALEEALEGLERLPDNADVVSHMLENERFHTLIVQFSDSETLLDMYRRLRAHIQIAQIHYRSTEWRGRRDTERSEHRAILDAIRSNEPNRLTSELKQHLERACEALLEDIGRKQDGRYPSAAIESQLKHRRRDDEPRYTRSDAWDVAWWQVGEGPDIVLLHGYACSSEDWAAVARVLSRRWRVTRLDSPGHGRTRGPIPDSIFDVVRATAAVLERACTTPPVVVGHDMGGMVALSYLLEGGSASGVALADAFPSLRPVIEVFGPAEDERDPLGYGSMIDRQTPVHVENFVRAEMSAGLPGAGKSLLDSLQSFDVRSRLAELRQSAVLLLGNRRILSEAELPETLDRLGFSGLSQIETVLLDSHHFVMLEQPETVTRAIDRFAEKHTGPRPEIKGGSR